jgi:DNA end-binding protein Ku
MTKAMGAAALSTTAAPPSNRPTWSGLLQLSLVGIPVKAYAAVRAAAASSCHLLHANCGQRIRYAKHCPVHGTVDAAAITRGVAYAPGQHVILEPAELDALRPARDRALRLEHFVEPAHVDPALFSGRSLYLLPDGPAAERGYHVLRDSMRLRGRWAIGRVVLGGHRNAILVRPTTTTLVVHVLHYPEYLRACPTRPTPKITDAAATEERRLAGLLIDAATGTLAWETYRDENAAELRALVERKLHRQGTPAAEPSATLLPLLEALQKSIGTPVAVAVPPRRARGTSRTHGTHAAPRKRSQRSA